MSVVVGLFPLNQVDIYNAASQKSKVILDKGLDGKFPLLEGASTVSVPAATEGAKLNDARARAVVLHSLSNLIRSNKASFNSIQKLLTLLNETGVSLPASSTVSAQNDLIAQAFTSTDGLTADVLSVLAEKSAHSNFTARVALQSSHLTTLPLLADVTLGVLLDAFQVPKNAPLDLALGDALEMPAASLLASVRRIRNVAHDSKLTGADKEVAAALEETFASVVVATAALTEAADALNRQAKTALKTVEGGSNAFRRNLVTPAVEGASRAVQSLIEALEALNQHEGTTPFWAASVDVAFPKAKACCSEGASCDSLQTLESRVAALETLLASLLARSCTTLAAVEKDQHARALEKAAANPKVDVSKLKLKRLACGKGVTAVMDALTVEETLKVESLKALAEGASLPQWKEIGEQATAASNQETRRPKLAKGTQDFDGQRMAIREEVFEVVKGIFRSHGAVQIDTPVFELKETLTGKYGEDSKLIYDLKDQGGEALALRYDLTVPFARYLASNNVEKIKRFHIGKVYRRDEPQMSKGRFREFYQCDFDVAGQYDPLLPEAEVLCVMQQILSSLQLGRFEVKVNHRALLNGMMTVAGVELAKHRPICSAIDKLDKEPWEAVKREMVDLKGLAEEAADKLGQWVGWRGTVEEVCEKVEAHPELSANADIVRACQELRQLAVYLRALGQCEHIVLDLSLARGLDYYTGLIYEAVLPDAGVGSVAAGGRYDGLVGMFSGKAIPAVGMSIGVERVFSVMEKRLAARQQTAEQPEGIAVSPADILVCSLGESLTPLRLEICKELWAAGVAAELPLKAKMHPKKALEQALEARVPLMLVLGEDEAAKGTVRLRGFGATEEERFEVEIPRGEVVQEVQKRLAQTGAAKDRLRALMGL